MDAFQLLLFVGFILPISVFVLYHSARVSKREQGWVRQFEELEALSGWTARERIYGRLMSYDVEYGGHTYGVEWKNHNARFFLQVRHQLVALPQLNVDEQYRFGWVDRLLGPDEELGDAVFDEAIEIEGDEVQITAMLNQQIRSVIKRGVSDGVSIADGVVELFEESAFAPKAELEVMLERISRVVNALSLESDAMAERLAQNVVDEPLAGVRARNMGMLLLHYPHELLTKQSLERIESMRDSGAPERVADLGSEAARIEALAGEPDRAVVALEWLRVHGRIPALIALRSYAVQPKSDYRYRLAQRAIEAIQERIGPVEGGGVAMVTETVGALSESPAGLGHLGLAQTPESERT